MGGRPSFLKRKREQDRDAKRRAKEERKAQRKAEAAREREKETAGEAPVQTEADVAKPPEGSPVSGT
jgi:hypothetical protein